MRKVMVNEGMFYSIILIVTMTFVFMGCATVYEAVTPLQFMDQEVGIQTLAILEEGATVPCYMHKVGPYFHVQGCICGFNGPGGVWMCQ